METDGYFVSRCKAGRSPAAENTRHGDIPGRLKAARRLAPPVIART